MPDQLLARGVEDQLKQAGVDTRGITWRDSGRLGTFFVEYATPPRSIQVIYDRAASCAAAMTLEDLDPSIVKGANVLHLSGITPALSKTNHALTRQVIDLAKESGVRVSFDVNYRAKLWSADAARATLTPLIENVDLLFCSQRDAQALWGIDHQGAALVDAIAGYTQATHIVCSQGEHAAVARVGTDYYEEPVLPVQVIDRLGAGDAMAAGYLYGQLCGKSEQALKYAMSMAGLALSQHGDFVQTSRTELESLVTGIATSEVIR